MGRRMFSIPTAHTYGVVLINSRGKVLLREPAGHFGGYVWALPKGRPEGGETPAETAMRVALEETGYRVELLDAIPQVFAGTTSSSAYFLAGPVGKQGKPTAETSVTRWVGFQEAARLIDQTTTKTGRERDQAILQEAVQVISRLPWDRRPATCGEDWDIEPLPRMRTEISLDLAFDKAAMRRIRKGFLPSVTEEKWFAWFDEPVLHLHRSWTGFCFFQIEFRRTEHGWRAVSAKLNRDAEQYTETDDNADRLLIANLLDSLLVNAPERQRADPMVAAVTLASQPNYLGSPTVVSELLQPVIEAAVAYVKGETNFNATWDMLWTLSQDVTSGDKYVRLPDWHTAHSLGNALVKGFGVRPEEMFADDLDYYVSEALIALFLKARDLLRGFGADPNAQWDPHALAQLNGLHQWATTVFLGTSDVFHPGVTLADFEWQRITLD